MTEKSVKIRLDTLMLEQGHASSRHRARALIMAGKVLVDGRKIEKPGREVDVNAHLAVEENLRYVSRGGVKLEAALLGFGIDPTGLVILDAGASTGGFTDCLLQHGAAGVIAVDVGYGQLDWRLRNDPRVVVMERKNIRLMDKQALPGPVDAAVADLSFISLKLVLPRLWDLIPPGAWIIALVKPQFEVGRGEVGKGGVVREVQKIRAAVESVKVFSRECGFQTLGELESPIKGPKGNQEVLIYLRRPNESPEQTRPTP
jgi:23S rRNA (cytidine1920-2'-O)/16S rRNA (cytidine1409-2'-O)-methyltransferase